MSPKFFLVASAALLTAAPALAEIKIEDAYARAAMPNAKAGSVTFDVGRAVQELKAGKIEFRVDKAGVVHAPMGKVSFGAEKLLQNMAAFFDTLQRLKPTTAKGTYMQGISVSTTMGPGVRIDPLEVKNLIRFAAT